MPLKRNLQENHADKLKYYNIAKKVVQNRMVFFFHVSLYCTVIMFLLIINLMNFKGAYWVVWPAVFWAIALIGHFSSAYVFVDVFSKNPMQIERYARRASFYIHLIVYILTNLAMVFCNLKHKPDYFWAVYPIMGWGIGLFYHFFFVFIFRGWNIKKWKQKKTIYIMKKYFDIDPFDESESSE
ncbi:MAG: 2TM domain-containing protein [Candidatus Auribacterota bacterium]|jgi:hypothetical protein|nr:2TM domain-containing protein [Candidatus Auribacterota bacterium]